MRRPKLTIMKKLIISPNTGHYRFYSPEMNYQLWQKNWSKKSYPKPPVVDLSSEPSDYPHIPNIWTEYDLCRWIYDNWGAGFYRIIGHAKGRLGAWTFWQGEISTEGFQMMQKERRTKIKRALEKEYKEEEDPEFKAMIAEEIKEEGDKEAKVTYGFSKYLKQSGRRGNFITWEEGYDYHLQKSSPERQFEDWGTQKENKQKTDIWEHEQRGNDVW